jgi:hypothetical protein
MKYWVPAVKVKPPPVDTKMTVPIGGSLPGPARDAKVPTPQSLSIVEGARVVGLQANICIRNCPNFEVLVWNAVVPM